MNEISAIRQNEIDKCNDKMLYYEKKYKTLSNQQLNNIIKYLRKCLEETDDESEKNKLLEDITILERYT